MLGLAISNHIVNLAMARKQLAEVENEEENYGRLDPDRKTLASEAPFQEVQAKRPRVAAAVAGEAASSASASAASGGKGNDCSRSPRPTRG